MSDQTASAGGSPDPLDFRRHRPVEGNFGAGANSFAASAAFSVAGGNIVKVIPIAGALAITLRGLFATQGGTLSFAYLRPPPADATAYGVSNPANVTVTANTEFATTINPNGEGNLRITFAPGGTGSVTFFDQMQQ